MDEEKIEELEGEEGDDLLVLEAEGEEVAFDILGSIDYEGSEYVVLLPAEGEEEEAEVVILKVQQLETLDEDGEPEEEFVSVESEEVLNAVFDLFKQEYGDDFEFVE